MSLLAELKYPLFFPCRSRINEGFYAYSLQMSLSMHGIVSALFVRKQIQQRIIQEEKNVRFYTIWTNAGEIYEPIETFSSLRIYV